MLLLLLLLLFFKANKHKAAGKKIEAKQCKRLQRRFMWCSLCSGRRPHPPFEELWTGFGTGMSFLCCPVTAEMRLPISCVNSMAVSCHVPAVSMANG